MTAGIPAGQITASVVRTGVADLPGAT